MTIRAVRLSALLGIAGLALMLVNPATLQAADKKKKKTEEAPKQPNVLDMIDYSKVFWPAPPAPMRIKYLNYFCCDKYVAETGKKKSSWMDRMAGAESQEQQREEKGAELPEKKRRFRIVKLEERIAPGGHNSKNCPGSGGGSTSGGSLYSCNCVSGY